MFGYTTFAGNINGDLNILHGLELLIPSSGTETGNCDTKKIDGMKNFKNSYLLKV